MWVSPFINLGTWDQFNHIYSYEKLCNDGGSKRGGGGSGRRGGGGGEGGGEEEEEDKWREVRGGGEEKQGLGWGKYYKDTLM